MTAVIVGMHRTGSSLIAKASNLLGLDLGPTDRLMDAKPDNPTGFWENLDVVEINDDLLGLLGGRWDDLPAPAHGWEQSRDLDEMRERAGIVVRGFGVGTASILKDPRMSVTLPFWRTVGVFEPVVISIRHPDEVAESLRRRDSMSRATAVDLWLQYTVAACRVAPESLIVDYKAFLDDPARSSVALATHFGLGRPDDSTIAKIAEFASPELRHHVSRPDVEPVPSEALARWLYERLVEVGTCSGLDQFDWSVINNTCLAYRLERLPSRLGASDTTIEELFASQRAVASEAAEFHDRVHAELVQAQLDFKEARATIDDLIRQRDAAIEGRDGLAQSSQEYRLMSRRELDAVERRNRELGQDLDAARVHLDAATSKLNELESHWIVRVLGRGS